LLYTLLLTRLTSVCSRAYHHTLSCRRLFNTGRLELLEETVLFIWDEFLNNDKEIFDSVITFLEQTGAVFLCVGDPRQILPVKTGPACNSIEACFTSSRHWRRFNVIKLQQNMRLSLASAQITDDTTDEERAIINKEVQYAATIRAIGEGRDCKHSHVPYVTFLVLRLIVQRA
jgi:hypothetical protein